MHTLYAGPVMICNQKHKFEMHKYLTCGVASHRKYYLPDAEFCHHCGGKITEQESPVNKTYFPEHQEFIGKLENKEDIVFIQGTKGVHIYMDANKKYYDDLKDGDSLVYVLDTSSKNNKEISGFNVRFADKIAIAKTLYEKVKVTWRIIDFEVKESCLVQLAN